MKITPQKLYQNFLKKFGKPKWWPVDKKYHEKTGSDPRFEIIIGAILTQNTNWPNVEKALDNLKREKMLDIKKISQIDIKYLKKLIKPSGFFNQKAKRIKNISLYLKNNYNGYLDNFFKKDLKEIRKELLSLNGIGPETADSILLYAGNLPIFVVDSYTKRICERLAINIKQNYEDIQDYFQKNLIKTYNPDEIIMVYNQLHALIVNFAKKYCKKKPDCFECFLKKHCIYAKKLFQ
ncbi:MAG: endonuclease [Candidatus Thermoplasmatota archaeon]|nr:endonuclease [Candidatus Thermoplasmatota archaeon]